LFLSFPFFLPHFTCIISIMIGLRGSMAIIAHP
jgi:hypothetical protein